jgi:hypothetical protein
MHNALNNMLSLKIYKDWIFVYENELSKYESTKIDINSNNKIEIIKEYILNPIIENYEELLFT